VPIEYDPMISKLAAWAPDRAAAIARMRRALGEYLITGVATTLPFFEWLLSQAAFVEGRVHTTYLDDILAAREGQPFAQADPAIDHVAAIAAALQLEMAADAAAPGGASSPLVRRWTSHARDEMLR
jgi:acetyl-CoA carboxylase biotin carboxylase subunit